MLGKDKIEEVVVYDGKSLVVHRILNTIMMTKDESWLCHNIFYTKCTSKGMFTMSLLIEVAVRML